MKLDYDIDFYHVIKQNKRRVEQMTETDFFDEFEDGLDDFTEVNLTPYKEKFKYCAKTKDSQTTEQQLNNKISNLQKDISQLNIKIMSEKAKLNNKEFLEKSPKSMVEKTMKRIKEYEKDLKSKSNENLKLIGKLDRVK
jgi:valyl-tRNA synthetase